MGEIERGESNVTVQTSRSSPCPGSANLRFGLGRVKSLGHSVYAPDFQVLTGVQCWTNFPVRTMLLSFQNGWLIPCDQPIPVPEEGIPPATRLTGRRKPDGERPSYDAAGPNLAEASGHLQNLRNGHRPGSQVLRTVRQYVPNRSKWSKSRLPEQWLRIAPTLRRLGHSPNNAMPPGFPLGTPSQPL
jgi:hypothetical protein